MYMPAAQPSSVVISTFAGSKYAVIITHITHVWESDGMHILLAVIKLRNGHKRHRASQRRRRFQTKNRKVDIRPHLYYVIKSLSFRSFSVLHNACGRNMRLSIAFSASMYLTVQSTSAAADRMIKNGTAVGSMLPNQMTAL